MTKPALRYWRVDFADGGAVSAVTEIQGPAHADWVVVEAPDEGTAKRKAYNFYCARKKRLASARHHAKGNCRCGRPQDREKPGGGMFRICSTCSERDKGYDQAMRQRAAQGVTNHQRDEQARVASNLGRQRDRRAEIRLETLIEVRERWRKQPNVGLFARWLQLEIDAITGAEPREGAAA